MSESRTERPGPSRSVIGAAVVVAIIVVLGVVLTISNLLGTSRDPVASPGPSTPGPIASWSSSSPAVVPSICGLTETADSGTLTKAPVATWSLLGTTAVPAIPSAGPGRVDGDGYRSCFARTPIGALVAAANILGLGSYAPVRQKFYADSTVPGPGRDVLLAKPPPGSGAGGTRIQIMGFRILRYTGTFADVDIAVRTSSGALAGAVVNMEWSGGDWKIRVAPDGRELSPVAQLPDLAGYVLWSGA